jgi:hypothetical protein
MGIDGSLNLEWSGGIKEQFSKDRRGLGPDPFSDELPGMKYEGGVWSNVGPNAETVAAGNIFENKIVRYDESGNRYTGSTDDKPLQVKPSSEGGAADTTGITGMNNMARDTTDILGDLANAALAATGALEALSKR